MYNNLSILSLCSHHEIFWNIVFDMGLYLIRRTASGSYTQAYIKFDKSNSITQNSSRVWSSSPWSRHPQDRPTQMTPHTFISWVSSYIFRWHGYWETEEKVILTYSQSITTNPTEHSHLISSSIMSILEDVKILEGNPLISSCLMKSRVVQLSMKLLLIIGENMEEYPLPLSSSPMNPLHLSRYSRKGRQMIDSLKERLESDACYFKNISVSFYIY